MAAIRKVVSGRSLAFCLSNHDLWVRRIDHREFSSLNDVVAKFWREPARENCAMLLDEESVDLGDVVVAGGYTGLPERIRDQSSVNHLQVPPGKPAR